tara:strand:- start:68 stop:478 length:411 start_codon:yes stop_codon:yes gene_type:complete
MKFLIVHIIILTLFYNISKAESQVWTKVIQGNNGYDFFVDIKTIQNDKNIIFFWQLINYKKKDEYGDMSAKIYIKGNCKNFKFKWLKVAYHKLLMAEDEVYAKKPSDIVADWQLAIPNSTSYAVIDYVCSNKGILL